MIDIKEKPKSLPLIDFFIRKTAIKTLVPEEWTEAIIKDQWRSLHQETRENFDIEITGIGVLKISKNLANTVIKKKNKLKDNIIKKIARTEEGQKKEDLVKMLEEVEQDIQIYQGKVNRYEDRLQRTDRGSSK